MTTHPVPQQQHGRFHLPWKWLLLIVLLLTLTAMVLVVVQYWLSQTTTQPLPTPMAQATVPIAATTPQIEISPRSGTAGTLVTVIGRGWQTDDRINIALDDLGSSLQAPVYAQTTVNQAGEFFVAFTVPANVTWQHLPDIAVVAASTTANQQATAAFELLLETPTAGPTMTATPAPTAAPPTATLIPPTPTCVYNMTFVADISIPDDTPIPAGAGFLKTWRIRNSGTCPWPAGTEWVFVSGSQMGGPAAVPVAVTNPGDKVDVSVYLIAPKTPGTYVGYWSLRLPGGQPFTKSYFVRIVVPAPTNTPAPPTATSIPATAIPATATPVIYNWRGEYYKNNALSGTPALVRDDATIDFNWQDGAPAAALPADNFSARWSRSLYLDGGTYRFYLHADDGVRLWIDNTLLINEWHDARGDTYTADVLLGRGNHLLQVEYYEAFGMAHIQFWWQGMTAYPEWRGEYWSNSSLSGLSTLVRNDTTLNFNWGTDAPAAALPADHFSVRWTRTLPLPEGHYRFHVAMDDGLRLYVDDTLLIDEWHDGSRREGSAAIFLEAGRHDLTIEYYEKTGSALVEVNWEQVDAPAR